LDRTDRSKLGRYRAYGPNRTYGPYGADRLESLLSSGGTWLLREEDIEALVADVEAANGGPLSDDLVVVALSPALARADGSGGSGERPAKP